MIRISALCALAFAAVGCAPAAAPPVAPSPAAAPAAPERALAPRVGHHQHLRSPMLAARTAAAVPDAGLPAELAALVRAREAAWNDSLALARLYAPDAVALNPWETRWVSGPAAAGALLSRLFASAFAITPVSVAVDGPRAQVAGYLSRTVDGTRRHFGQVLLGMRRGGDGAWHITAESLSFGVPSGFEVVTADQLIAQMDAAGVQRGVVLSLGYGWARRGPVVDPDEQAKVRAENDWTVAQVARFPDRLVAFCGVNPLRDYAPAEVQRCGRELRAKGLKLHFGNSGVDLRDPEHVRKVREVFRAANALGMPIVAHLRVSSDAAYGPEHSEIFLAEILPAAPDVVVQVAHMADAGPGFRSDAALERLAQAVEAGDPRTRNLYFDATTNVTVSSPPAVAALLARRMRQIGLERILFGSDGGWGGNPPMRDAWVAFRGILPLTDDEMRTIAGNVAPYLR